MATRDKKIAPFAEKELRFLSKWTSGPRTKCRYMLIGAALWAAALVTSSWWNADFVFARLNWHRPVFGVLFGASIGLLMGYWSYRSQKKRYLEARSLGLIP